jgi:O-antigen/teichoic acid export membrane protein
MAQAAIIQRIRDGVNHSVGEHPAFWGKVLETYSTRVVLLGFALGITVLVSRFLGPAGRGFFAVATAVGAMGVQFGNLGLHASNTFYVAQNRKLLPTLIGNTLVVSFGGGTLAVLISGLVFALCPRLAPVQGRLLILALAWIPFGLAYMLLQNLLLGIQEIRDYNKAEIAGKVATAALLGFVIWSGRISALTMFAATFGGLLFSLVFVAAKLRNLLEERLSVCLATFKRTIPVGMKAYLIAFFGYLVLRIDLLMVQYLLGAKQAGFYSISETLAENILLLPVVIGLMLFPKLSAMEDLDEKFRLTKRALLVTTALLLPVLVGASVAARPLLRLVFGEAYVPSAPAFIWLMPGSFFLGIETVLVQFLNSLGFPKALVVAWLAVVVANIGINLWAIPRYGIVGSSIVSSVCYFAIFLLIVGIVWSTRASQKNIQRGAVAV